LMEWVEYLVRLRFHVDGFYPERLTREYVGEEEASGEAWLNGEASSEELLEIIRIELEKERKWGFP